MGPQTTTHQGEQAPPRPDHGPVWRSGEGGCACPHLPPHRSLGGSRPGQDGISGQAGGDAAPGCAGRLVHPGLFLRW